MTDLRILFFGDSFVAGVGDPTGLGWVGRAVSAAFDAGVPLRFYNLGVGGDTSALVVARWRTEMNHRLDPEADTRLVVSVGANDATLIGRKPRVAPADSEANLAAILDNASKLELPSFIVGPAPVGEPTQDERIAALDDAFARLATERETPYVAVHKSLQAEAAWAREASDFDGVHPGALGYSALCRLVIAGGWLQWLVR